MTGRARSASTAPAPSLESSASSRRLPRPGRRWRRCSRPSIRRTPWRGSTSTPASRRSPLPGASSGVSDGKPEGHGKKAFIDLQNDVTAADIAARRPRGSIARSSTSSATRPSGMGIGPGQDRQCQRAAPWFAGAMGQEMAALGVHHLPAAQHAADLWRPCRPRMSGRFLRPKRAARPLHQAPYRGRRRVRAARAMGNARCCYPRAPAKTTEAGRAARMRRGAQRDRHPATIRRSARSTSKARTRSRCSIGSIPMLGNSLKVGHCRYGVMLREDGIILDDGVTARLGEASFSPDDHHRAAMPRACMPGSTNWLQMRAGRISRCCITPVTSAPGRRSTSPGPRAREVLAAAGTDIDLRREAFPLHAMVREGNVAGIPARVFRISFTGELSYENQRRGAAMAPASVAGA